MNSSSSRLRLVTRRDVERRLHELYWVLREIYGRDIVIEGEKTLDPINLYTTQESLESDKLGLVLRKTLYEGYNVPIIVVRGYRGILYILDGHHRARVALWLRTPVNAYVLNIPLYRPRQRSLLIRDIKVINPPEHVPDPIVNIWRHMVNIIYFIERKHGGLAYVAKNKLRLRELYVTQKTITPKHLPPSVINEPILVYKYRDEQYIIDGHTRACIHLLFYTSEYINAVEFTLDKRIGLIDSAIKIGKLRLSREWCTSSLR
jgi:hypothetical protein